MTRLDDLQAESPSGNVLHAELIVDEPAIQQLLHDHAVGIANWARSFPKVWMVLTLVAGKWAGERIYEIIRKQWPTLSDRIILTTVRPGGGGDRSKRVLIDPCPHLCQMHHNHGVVVFDAICDEGKTLDFLWRGGHVPHDARFDYLFCRPGGPAPGIPHSLCKPLEIQPHLFKGEAEPCHPFVLGCGTDFGEEWTRGLSFLMGVPWRSRPITKQKIA